MQEGFALPTWIQNALGSLAWIATGAGIHRLITTWLNRKKPAAEITLTQATASEVSVRAGSSAGDAVMRMMDRLDAAQVTIDRLRSERDDWRVKAMNAEADGQTAQLFVDQLNAAAKLTICEHHPHGVRLSDYLPRQLNPPK